MTRAGNRVASNVLVAPVQIARSNEFQQVARVSAFDHRDVGLVAGFSSGASCRCWAGANLARFGLSVAAY